MDIDLNQLEKITNQGTTNLDVEYFVDVSEQEDLPDWFKNINFTNMLIVHPNCDLNQLPRRVCSLCIGGTGSYTIDIKRENLNGLPLYIDGFLRIQSSFLSFDGAENSEIDSNITFTIKRIKDFTNLPRLTKKVGQKGRVSIFGNDLYTIALKNFWKCYPEFQGQENLCCMIQEVCERDFCEDYICKL